jgi:hypothetical protein
MSALLKRDFLEKTNHISSLDRVSTTRMRGGNSFDTIEKADLACKRWSHSSRPYVILKKSARTEKPEGAFASISIGNTKDRAVPQGAALFRS